MQNHSTPSQITPFSSKARAELGELHTDMSNSAARTTFIQLIPPPAHTSTQDLYNNSRLFFRVQVFVPKNYTMHKRNLISPWPSAQLMQTDQATSTSKRREGNRAGQVAYERLIHRQTTETAQLRCHLEKALCEQISSFMDTYVLRVEAA